MPTMARLFGTDGVRGLANVDITAELALYLSVAAAHVLGAGPAQPGRKPKAVVGRDPRASGEFLSPLRSSPGWPLPASTSMTSASCPRPPLRSSRPTWTPTSGSCCRPRTTRCRTTASSSSPPAGTSSPTPWRTRSRPGSPEGSAHRRRGRPGSNRAGRPLRRPPARASPTGSTGSRSSSTARTGGVRGVARGVPPAGAEVSRSAPSPTASTSTTATARPTSTTARRSSRQAADLASPRRRCRPLPRRRRRRVEFDGDQIMAILAGAMKSGHARKDTVVATVMWNLGFRLAMEREGIPVTRPRSATATSWRRCAPGPHPRRRAVGHVMLLDSATTGDGVLTGLMLAARINETGRSLADLASVIDGSPQVLVNVRSVDRASVETEGAPGGRGEKEKPSTGPGACCCARAAPSRSSASWSRRHPDRRRRSRNGSRTSSRSASPSDPATARGVVTAPVRGCPHRRPPNASSPCLTSP